MKKGLIVFTVIGSVLLLTGGALLGIAIATHGFDSIASTGEVVTNKHEVNETFTKFDINTVTADVEFKASEDASCSVICEEREKVYHTVEVIDNALTIKQVDELHWYEKIFTNFNRMKVTLYLPTNTYDNLKIKGVTGDVIINNFSFTEQNIETTTGDIKLSDVNGTNTSIKVTTGKVVLTNYTNTGSLKVDSTTGDTTFKNVNCDSAELLSTNSDYKLDAFLVTNHLKIDTTTGDVDFLNCDAGTLNIHTTTGHVQGNLLTPKDFKAHTTTGTVTVYSTEGAPECVVDTTTGDITLTVGAK